MKKFKNTLLIAGTVALFSASAVMADAQNKNSSAGAVDMETILINLNNAGCSAVKEVEREHNVYKAKAVCAGQYLKVRIDSKTGDITSPDFSADDKRISMLDAVKAVKDAGYTNIKEVEAKSNHYEIKAMKSSGDKNKKVELEVDATSGKINEDKDWF